MHKLIASLIAATFLLTGSAMASSKPMHATKHVKMHAASHKTHVQKMAQKKSSTKKPMSRTHYATKKHHKHTKKTTTK